MPVEITIPLHLVDEPDDPMRHDMDDDKLRDLAESIRRDGLTHPVAVTKVGDRYKVVAGHRRLLAHRMLGKPTIQARDYTDDGKEPDAIMWSENFYREEVSDADMAIQLSAWQDRKHYTLEQLMQITGRSESWIAQRLALFEGDQAVFEALRKGEINLGHAIELNKFEDDDRAQYLQTVIRSTPPISVLKTWRREAAAHRVGAPVIEEIAGTAPEGAAVAGVVVECCEVCGGNTMQWTFKFPRVHQHCWEMVQKALQESNKQ